MAATPAGGTDQAAQVGPTCGESVQTVSADGGRRQARCGATATRGYRYETPWHSWALVRRCETHAPHFELRMQRERTRYERLTDPAPR